MNSVTRCSASFSVQVVTLYEDRVVTKAPDPDVTFTFTFQLHSFAYVQPKAGKTELHFILLEQVSAQVHTKQYLKGSLVNNFYNK